MVYSGCLGVGARKSGPILPSTSCIPTIVRPGPQFELMDVNPDQRSQLIVQMFFDLSKKDAEEKVFCRCCENYFKDNKGFRITRYTLLL